MRASSFLVLLVWAIATENLRGLDIVVFPPLGSETDAVPAIRAAIDRAITEGATRILLAPGKYNFSPEHAFGEFTQVSNNDSGPRRIAFPLINCRNLEIDGQGARLEFHGQMIPFVIRNGEHITLRNLSIDWAQPFYMQGKVTAVDAVKQAFEIEVLPESNVKLKRGQLIYGQGKQDSPEGWWRTIEISYWVDPTTKAAATIQPRIKLWNERLCRPVEFEELAENLFRVSFAAEELPSVGSVMISKGAPNRSSPAILIDHSKNVLLEDIHIYHAGGMGIIAQRSDTLTLQHCEVTTPPGSPRLVSTTADATHFVCCKGLILVENCLFENMLDDGINVHGIYAACVESFGPATIGVRLVNPMQFGFDFAQQGDVLRFSSRETLLKYGEGVVTSVQRINEAYLKIQFDRPVEQFVTAQACVDNLSWQPDVIFRHNVVRNNRARSLLISSGSKVLIEENKFERPSMSVFLIEGDCEHWYESGPVQDIIFRRNVVIGNDATLPLMQFSPYQSGVEQLLPPYHRNILIENNVFYVVQPHLINARRIGGLYFLHNTVKFVGNHEAYLHGPTFTLNTCEDVSIAENTFTLPAAATVEAEPNGMTITEAGNQGLAMQPP
jgi:hypothetical protein